MLGKHEIIPEGKNEKRNGLADAGRLDHARSSTICKTRNFASPRVENTDRDAITDTQWSAAMCLSHTHQTGSNTHPHAKDLFLNITVHNSMCITLPEMRTDLHIDRITGRESIRQHRHNLALYFLPISRRARSLSLIAINTQQTHVYLCALLTQHPQNLHRNEITQCNKND